MWELAQTAYLSKQTQVKTGEIRESGETGDTREEEDTQWRQVSTLYTRILRTVADSAYFVISYMKYIATDFIVEIFSAAVLLLLQ